jgi:uncharacterized protein
MNLEMLDGYLAAIVAAPRHVPPAQWMPGVWSADDEPASFVSPGEMQRAIGLVLRFHNELVTTLGAAPDQDDEEGVAWEPFVYAPAEAEADAPGLGDEWVAGFEQGLECWPEDWDEGLPEDTAHDISDALEEAVAPFLAEDAQTADQDTRLVWIVGAAEVLRDVRAGWAELGQPGPQLVPVELPEVSAGGPGRNEPCPCGSGKKYKKCCGAVA